MPKPIPPITPVTLDAARAAKTRAGQLLGHRLPIAGIGIAQVRGSLGLKVNLHDAVGDMAEMPEHIDGVPVLYEVVGGIKAGG